MKKQPVQDDSIEIFSGSLWEVEMLRTLLNDAQVSNFVLNSTLKDFMYHPIKAEGVKIMVLERDLEEARQIVSDYLHNLNK
jgi:hypothetical protein